MAKRITIATLTAGVLILGACDQPKFRLPSPRVQALLTQARAHQLLAKEFPEHVISIAVDESDFEIFAGTPIAKHSETLVALEKAGFISITLKGTRTDAAPWFPEYGPDEYEIYQVAFTPAGRSTLEPYIIAEPGRPLRVRACIQRFGGIEKIEFISTDRATVHYRLDRVDPTPVAATIPSLCESHRTYGWFKFEDGQWLLESTLPGSL